jgi:hypothetical protein
VNRRLVIAGVAAAAVTGAVVPAFAQTGTTTLPVTVYTDTSDGVAVGFYVNGQPGAGAHVSPDGQACAGISYQLPVCVDAGTVVDEVNRSVSVGGLPVGARQSLPLPPVVVYQDENGTTVGVGDVGVRAGNNGICPLVSTQTWQCIGGEG